MHCLVTDDWFPAGKEPFTGGACTGESPMEELRAKAAKWTLADDSELFTRVQSLLNGVVERSERFSATIEALDKQIRNVNLDVATVNAAIGLHSASQFIEQRVADDDYRPRRSTAPSYNISLEERQKMILQEVTTAVRGGLQLIKANFRPIGEPPFIQYEPIDKYNLPIPPLIGSDEFKTFAYPEEVYQRDVRAPSAASTTKVEPPPLQSAEEPAAAPSIPHIVEAPKEERKIEERSPAVTVQPIPPPPPDMPKSITAKPPSPSIQKARPAIPEQPQPMASEPMKKSIFDYSSDDDKELFATLSRTTKPPAPAPKAATTVIEKKEERDEKKPHVLMQPSTLADDLAKMASSAVARKAEMDSGRMRKDEGPPKETIKAPEPQLPTIPSTSATVPKNVAKNEPPPKKKWVPGKSIFDDSDSDSDLFKPATIRKPPTAKAAPPKKEPANIQPYLVEPQPAKKAEPEKKKEWKAPTQGRSIFDSDSDLDDLFKPKKSIPPPSRPAPQQAKGKEETVTTHQVPSSSSSNKSSSSTLVASTKRNADSVNRSSLVEKELATSVREEKKKEQEQPPQKETDENSTKEELTESSLKQPQVPGADEKEDTRQEPIVERPRSTSPLPPVSTQKKAENLVKEDSPPSLFDSPPPFEEPRAESPREEEEEVESEEDDMKSGGRAAFLDQLNAKLAVRPPLPGNPSARPRSMVEPPVALRSDPPPEGNRRSVAQFRSGVEEKKESGATLPSLTKGRPRGPVRRPPTKRPTSIVVEEKPVEAAKPPSPKAIPSSPKEASPSVPLSPKTTQPPTQTRKSSNPSSSTVDPLSIAPIPSTIKKTESQPIEGKTSASKPPSGPSTPVTPKVDMSYQPIERKTSASKPPSGPSTPITPKVNMSALDDLLVDPLSGLGISTSPIKTKSAGVSKFPTTSTSAQSTAPKNVTTSSATTTKTSAASSTAVKKSIFDSDSDGDFFDTFSSRKASAAKTPTFEASSSSKTPSSSKSTADKSASKQKSIFDDSDDDLDIFRKK